ncbi:MAG: hypothetical protein ACFFCW_41460 [Candidatus Hodarchaeota archaeon]
MSKIRNTTQDDPILKLFTASIGSGRGIEEQEAAGQSQLVNSTQLPVRVMGDKATLESAGVVFGKPCEGDPLFCEATLPDGWKKRATEHPMWSELVDADGNVKANIFYKAAFYDRDTFISVVG